MENNLTIQEWLIKTNRLTNSQYTLYDCDPILMEGWANYKTKEIYGLLFEFRNKILLNGGLSDFTILKKFDEHFKIEKVREYNE